MSEVSSDFKKALLVIGGIKIIDFVIQFYLGMLNSSTVIAGLIGIVLWSGLVTGIVYVIRKVFKRKNDGEETEIEEGK